MPLRKNKKKGVDKRKKVCYNIYIERKAGRCKPQRPKKLNGTRCIPAPLFLKVLKSSSIKNFVTAVSRSLTICNRKAAGGNARNAAVFPNALKFLERLEKFTR